VRAYSSRFGLELHQVQGAHALRTHGALRGLVGLTRRRPSARRVTRQPAILLKDKRCANIDAQTRGLMHREPMRQR
jgi:hypothetical protein